MRKALVLVSLIAIVSTTVVALLVVYPPTAGNCAPAGVALVGDAARGAKLHQGCFGCHGIERYTQPVTHASATFMDSLLRASGLSDLPPAEPKRFKGTITSVDALRAAVIRRNDYFNPQLTAQEIEDVVAYLNKAYYNFPEK